LDPLMMLSPDGSISDVNEAAVKTTGVSREDLIGTDFIRYFTSRDKAREGFQRALVLGWAANFPLTMCGQNDILSAVLCNASAFRDAAGNVLGVLVVIRDVTEHMLRDEAVYRLATMVEFSGEAMIGTTLDGIVTSWNPAAERMHGYSAEDALGKSIGLLIPDDRTGEVGAILARIIAGQAVENFETMRLRRDGMMIPVSLTITPIRDPDGAIVGAIAIGRELTSQKSPLSGGRDA